MKVLKEEEGDKVLKIQGEGAGKSWVCFFQELINKTYSEFNPIELIEWKEKNNEDIQTKGRKYATEIEKKIKQLVLEGIKEIYGDNWDLEISAIKRKCIELAEAEIEKQDIETKERIDIPWIDMFTIMDYKKIITDNWTKQPTNKTDFITFEKLFSINIGEEFNSKSDKVRWLSKFNSYRNLIAHEGTKEKAITRKEVEFLENIHNHFYK